MTQTGLQRESAYGQLRDPTRVDRLGTWLNERAVRRHAQVRGTRVADLGCGFHARLVTSLLPQLSSAVVVDVALDERLQREPNLTAIEGSIPDVTPTLESGSLDLVLCLNVLEHLWEPQNSLSEFKRLLAPGGAALVNVPSWRGKRFLELAAFRLGVSPAEEMDDHKRYYDPRDLWPMLIRAGFLPSQVRCFRHKFGLNTFAVCRVPDREARA